ncbi:MAG: DUF4203 domain-containing protein [bacterium]|nr:DUF4203 domain-containing protein [bacterium]
MNLDIAELALGGGSIAVGILSCFFGARYFRPVLSLTGFIIGLFIGIAIIAANNGTTQIGFGGIALGVGIGLFLAFVLYFLFDWSVIIAGAMLGVAAGFFIINILNLPTNSTTSFIIIAVCAVIGAGVGYGIRRLIVVLGTAFNGAMFIVYGLSIFIPSIGFVLRFRDLEATRATWLASALILGLGILGTFVQWNITGKRLRNR